jgi:hypothetical protein
MAFYIELLKTDQEDNLFVYYVYRYSLPGEKYETANGKTRFKLKEVSGKLKIDKNNGDVHTIELAEGDNGMHAQRACWALMKHWKLGEYPDKTCWAS